jgi:hypothetical protein
MIGETSVLGTMRISGVTGQAQEDGKAWTGYDIVETTTACVDGILI